MFVVVTVQDISNAYFHLTSKCNRFTTKTMDRQIYMLNKIIITRAREKRQEKESTSLSVYPSLLIVIACYPSGVIAWLRVGLRSITVRNMHLIFGEILRK